jgi:hypothetical protein
MPVTAVRSFRMPADLPGVTALPEIEISGGSAFQHELPRLCRKVAAGKIVRVVHLQTGRHRAWFLRSRPPGSSPERVTIYQLGRGIGGILEDIRDGQVVEVWNGNDHRTVGYLFWSAPEWLALLADAPMTYTYRSKSGRVIRRDFYPLAVQAEPVTRRRRELADA